MTCEIFFFQNHVQNEAERIVPDLFLIFNKNKNKLYTTLGCRSRYMLNFDFLEKSLGIVSFYFLLTDQISLSDCLLEILGNMGSNCLYPRL